MTRKNYLILKNTITKSGGATLDKNGEFLALSRGYIVSVEKYGSTISLEALSLGLVNKYLRQAKIHGLLLGFWLDNGKLYIDLNERFLNKKKAITFGKKNKQLAVFNCKTKESIFLN